MLDSGLLLRTKISPPITRHQVVERPRLDRYCEQALAHPVTLICAPAGFGKSTVITNWHQSQASTEIPLAWVSLDEDDSEPAQFATYITAALDDIKPDILEQMQSLLNMTPPPAPQTIAALLIKHLFETPVDFLLVLDDYHRIDNAQVHEAVTYLIEHMPPRMHLVITTREDPPLPLGRLRARGQLVEIREAELRFTPEETARFIRSEFDLALTDAQLAALDERIEGWAAGLKLAALALRGRTDVNEFIRAFSGSHRYVVDYLMEEVFERQPEDIRHFLLETSILRAMTGSLCAAVTEKPEMVAQQLLERISELNLFIIPLDSENQWFRYHHLFAAVLRHRQQRAAAAQTVELHRRAAAWYAQQQQLQTVMYHLFEAKAFAEAARYLGEHGFDYIEREGYEHPLSWIHRLPPDALHAAPELLLLAAFLYTKTQRGHLPEVRLWLNQVQTIANSRADAYGQRLQARINVLESILAQELENDLARSAMLLAHALPLIADDYHWYVNAALQKAWVHMLQGEPDAARVTAGEVITLAEQHHGFNVMMEAYKILGIVLQYEGRFGEAVRVLEMANARARAWGQMHHAELANVLFNLSRITILRGELELAHAYCEQTLAIAEPLGISALTTPAWLHLAELQWLLGMKEEAHVSTEKAAVVIAANPELDVPVELSTYAFVLALIGSHEQARQSMLASGLDLRPNTDTINQNFDHRPWLLLHLLRTHVLMLDLQFSPQPLSTWDAVLVWVNEILRHAVERKTAIWELRARAMLSVIYVSTGAVERGLDMLRSALALAEPERVVYPFCICGDPMRNLLQRLHQRGESTPFSASVLAAFAAFSLNAESPAAPRPAPAGDLEPLTERELEVLHLIHQGLSNTEIAQKLYVSIGTVKRHVANIFIKLGADSRTHALAIARDYGLL